MASPLVKAAACIVLLRVIASKLMGDEAGSSAQRIRIGLTGLAFAFLLVLLGSVISRSREDNGPATAAEQVEANDAEPDEPLAKLGVAPGGAEATDNTTGNNGE